MRPPNDQSQSRGAPGLHRPPDAAAAGLVLVALFIWIAENVGVFTAAWTCPDPRDGWRLVGLGKLGAWRLL
ncbi:MAG: DUF817 family protein, partial [Phenylobacterium sp.]|nr:DUF817 family protein [Phenylobacterium sp.]